MLDHGAKWKDLPQRYGSKSSVHRWFLRWVKAGVFEELMRSMGTLIEEDGRLYYTPGAHGGSEEDGTPIVQFDVQTKQRKVIAFLHPTLERKYGVTLRGTYSSAVDPSGEKLYVTWNVSPGTKVWDSCALTTIHIPASERP